MDGSDGRWDGPRGDGYGHYEGPRWRSTDRQIKSRIKFTLKHFLQVNVKGGTGCLTKEKMAKILDTL